MFQLLPATHSVYEHPGLRPISLMRFAHNRHPPGYANDATLPSHNGTATTLLCRTQKNTFKFYYYSCTRLLKKKQEKFFYNPQKKILKIFFFARMSSKKM